MKEEPTRRLIRELLVEQRYCVLATVDGARPLTSLMAFAASDDLAVLVMATDRDTTKFANIQSNPSVSVLVDNRSNRAGDVRDAVALTVEGTAREISGEAPTDLREAYLRRHPHLSGFLADPGCAMVAIEVSRYNLVSEFQKVRELRLDASAGCP
jgi:nitroimidazol reductase NimA-like FMN-containing flavoprotein (pyridoxamine 5'-phosphate oxidase superfamily)